MSSGYRGGRGRGGGGRRGPRETPASPAAAPAAAPVATSVAPEDEDGYLELSKRIETLMKAELASREALTKRVDDLDKQLTATRKELADLRVRNDKLTKKLAEKDRDDARAAGTPGGGGGGGAAAAAAARRPRRQRPRRKRRQRGDAPVAAPFRSLHVFPPAEAAPRPRTTHSTGRVERHLLSNMRYTPTYHMHRTYTICAASRRRRRRQPAPRAAFPRRR